VLSKYVLAALPVLSFFAASACAKTSEQEIQKESRQIKQRLCDQKNMADAQSALTSFGIAYDMSDHDEQLNAIKRFNKEGLVSSAIVIEVRSADKVVKSCAVRVLRTGP